MSRKGEPISVETGPGSEQGGGQGFWPCVGEHPVYDGALYELLASDEARNAQFLRALERAAPGRVVLDLGTGGQALWAIEAARLGASRVYAVEADSDSAEQARSAVKSAGYEDRVTVLEGNGFDIDPPERAEVCVSEVLGEIGGAEGAVKILNDVRSRWLVEGGTMIPARCRTLFAPVTLPADLLIDPPIDPQAVRYLHNIFQHYKRPFDVRISCAGRYTALREGLLSQPEVFEDLDFRRETPDERELSASFVFPNASATNGFVLWLSLDCSGNDEVLDTLEIETNWFPVVFPVWPEALKVGEGDQMRINVRRKLSDDDYHPDYLLEGVLNRGNGEKFHFSWQSLHHAPGFKQTPFYAQLFRDTSEG